jgi:IS4 transposase
MLAEIFKPFVEASPVSVMARGALERLLSPKWVDEVFEANSRGQYTRNLLFSSVFTLMVRVVFGFAKSVRRAYLPKAEAIAVSLAAVYSKLLGIEPATSAALVRESGRTSARMVRELGGCRPAWLPGYRIRILDGNALASTQHRIKELRTLGAGALPGKALVVYDPESGCVLDAVPCEDGHAQERALLTDILASVQAGDLWIEDRNFCTRRFLFGVVSRRGHLLVREHRNLPVVEVGPERPGGDTETGRVSEQDVDVHHEDGQQTLRLRRMIVRLHSQTRDGDRVIHLLTTLPTTIEATTIANLYRGRWRIETAFQELERDLHSEINTLGYPRAALFAFCVAIVAYNIIALVYGALRAQHGATRIEEEFSHYYLADELQMTHAGMMIAIPEPHWTAFAEMTDKELAATLLFLSARVNLKMFPKTRRGPKKPPPKKVHDPNTPHVSTARILAARKARDKS